eukprot:scaffold158053_cov17-Tisochrysis_lutea.AAC.2
MHSSTSCFISLVKTRAILKATPYTLLTWSSHLPDQVMRKRWAAPDELLVHEIYQGDEEFYAWITDQQIQCGLHMCVCVSAMLVCSHQMT